MTVLYADLKPPASDHYLDLVRTKGAALLPAAEYQALYEGCKARWDGFAQSCQDYYQRFTNEDLSIWTDRNRHVGHPSETVQQLDAWCASETGQETLARVATSFVEWLNENGDAGAPGHDRRHVMFKDVAEGRSYAEEDGIEGHKLCFFIGSLMHDSGRLLEERLSGTTLSGIGSVQHPYWSAEIVSMLFARERDMPQELKNDILLSILAHQAGQTNWHFMSQAVQRGDRIGGLASPELFTRLIQFDVMELKLQLETPAGSIHPDMIALPGSPHDDNLLGNTEFFCRFLYPNVGLKSEARVTQLAAANLAAIMLASSDTDYAIRFAPELGRMVAPSPERIEALRVEKMLPKRQLSAELFEAAEALRQNILSTLPVPEDPDQSLRNLLAGALTRPGSNLHGKGVTRLGSMIDRMDEGNKVRLYRALTLIEAQRDVLDFEDKAILARPSGIGFVDAISKGALAIANLPPMTLPNPEGLFRDAGPARPGMSIAKPGGPAGCL